MPHTRDPIAALDAQEAHDAERALKARDAQPDPEGGTEAETETADAVDVWAVEGVFQQLVYSPKGAVEGVLIDTDGIPTQFVTDPHDAPTTELLAALKPGQTLVLEGIDAGPSPKGESPHTVYRFERLAAVDGRPPEPAPPHASVSGKVVRLNHARHGAPNGVLLDSGDFVHTRPDGFETLGLKVGDTLEAEGPARPLATGTGRVIEAHRANGHALAPRR
jgi:hypothetical protein